MAGRDPHVPPSVPKTAVGVTVADVLDLYYTNYVESEGLRDPVTVKGRLKALKEALGDLPVSALEKPHDLLRFKAVYRKGREIATVNRALATLLAALTGAVSRICRIARRRPVLYPPELWARASGGCGGGSQIDQAAREQPVAKVVPYGPPLSFTKSDIPPKADSVTECDFLSVLRRNQRYAAAWMP